MKHRLSQLLCACLVAMLTGCGLIDMEFDPITQQITNMSFNYDTVYVMKGDTFFLAPYIYPETVANKSIYLHSMNPDVVGVQNDTIFAAGEGTTEVMAVAVSNALSDTCTVIVMPRWQDSPYRFLNDMVVYAHVLVGGAVPQGQMLLGAFFEDELRGMAFPMNADRTLYCFRVWSDQFYVSADHPGSEGITFRIYDPFTLQLSQSSLTLPFDGQAHGTPSQPIEITFK